MEDRVISQSETGRNSVVTTSESGSETTEFPTMLRSLRDQRGLTKADLAKRTGYDPSTITRFEQGSRAPDREVVLHIAESMVLPLVDRDRLLAAAGFRSVIWDDPLLIELAQILVDSSIPEDARMEMRSVVRMAITYGLQRRNDR